MPAERSLFDRLKGTCRAEWSDYVRHPFVERLGDGTLDQSCFRRYLVQDYLFLIQFARAWGLAAYKADHIDDIAAASAGLAAILDETRLHVAFCARWGLGETDLQSADEDAATLAYSRFALDRGAAGDLLDLQVALAPCIIGYAEIGERLSTLGALAGNPYQDWIDAYAAPGYQRLAQDHIALLDRLMALRGGPGREAGLIETFRRATILEAKFWEAALIAPGSSNV